MAPKPASAAPAAAAPVIRPRVTAAEEPPQKKPKKVVDPVPVTPASILVTIPASDAAEPHALKCLEFIGTTMANYFTTPGFEQFKNTAGLASLAPLDIASKDVVGLSSYKEPWKHARCQASVTTTGMYEAGGNIFWVSWRRPTGESEAISGAPPRWSHVVEVATRWFSRDALVPGGPGERQRLVFPVPLLVHAKSLDNIGTPFPASLEMLSGHLWVWAWARGMMTAITTHDTNMVRALLEAALTATIHLKVGMSMAAQAAATIVDSELNKTKDKLSSDSFLAFARKCWVIFSHADTAGKVATAGGKSTLLKTLGVTYGGSPVGKSMLTAILHLSERFSKKALAIMAEIEYAHGREVLTLHYTKLGRLGTLVAGTGLDLTPQEVGDYFLEYLKFALDFELVGPKDVTVDWMDKQRDGNPGALGTALGRRQLVALVASWVEDLKESPQGQSLHGELSEVLPMFAGYASYEKAFPMTAAAPSSEPADSSLAAPQGQDDGAASDDEDAVDKVKRRFHNSVTHSAINFLYDVLAGVHDDAIKEAVRGASLRDAKWMESGALAGLRDIFRSLTAHRAMVQLSGGPPAPEARTLQRYKSEAHDEAEEAELQKERADTWRQVVGLRKKFVTFTSIRAKSHLDIQAAFERTAFFKMGQEMKAGEAHRLFVFSADLFAETQPQPWATPPAWQEAAQAAVQFAVQQRGPGDLLLFCDGRSRFCRRTVEKLAEDCRFPAEVFVIYSPTPRLGRRVAWAGNNAEVILASFPVNRTLLAARERDGSFNAAGESSTHDISYTGVKAVPWSALPLLSVADKAKLLATPQENVQVPSENLFASAGGIPLFWQDRKPVSFWKKLFTDMQAKCVVDLTPGAGLAARAALERGIPYLGLARTAEHSQWLGNVLDRSAVHAAVTSGTALHSSDLEGSIKEHFGEVLDHIRDADVAEDKEAPEDEDQQDF